MMVPQLIEALTKQTASSPAQTGKPHTPVTAIIVGIETHICVTQTALDLLSMGHKVYIVADGVSSCNAGERPIALNRLARATVALPTNRYPRTTGGRILRRAHIAAGGARPAVSCKFKYSNSEAERYWRSMCVGGSAISSSSPEMALNFKTRFFGTFFTYKHCCLTTDFDAVYAQFTEIQ